MQRLQPGQSVTGGPPRLLVIEPRRAYLAVLARRLGDLGFRVVTARSAHEGLAELHRMPVDLILSELKLPGTSGTELVRMVRDDPAHRHLPVLLICGRSIRSRTSVEALEAGADGLIRKPFHFEVLAARIGREIERSRAMQRLRQDNAALDARIATRAIELGEMRLRWEQSEVQRARLEAEVRNAA